MVNRMQCLPQPFQATSQGMRALLAFTLALMLIAAVSPVAQAQTYTVLYTFARGTHGAQPWSGVIFDNAGNLYGTTNIGGDFDACPTSAGCGVVYELAPTGKETVLHKFTNTPDGFWPGFGNLLRDSAGDLYGTTLYGGVGDNGIVFELKKGKKEIILHSFPAEPGDGAGLEGSLIEDAAGNLYGTTFAGGNSGRLSAGTVFKITKTGQESVLHSFNVILSATAAPRSEAATCPTDLPPATQALPWILAHHQRTPMNRKRQS